MHVLSRLSHGFYNWFSFAVVAGLSLLVTILNLYISARLRMHAGSAYEPRPHLSVDLYGGYNYLTSAEW